MKIIVYADINKPSIPFCSQFLQNHIVHPTYFLERLQLTRFF